MEKNMGNIQETKKKLEGLFAKAGSRCVETAIEGCGERVSISAGYTLTGHEGIKDSYFMVTGDRMFPEYVQGLDSLAELLCRYDEAIQEQQRHTVDGFYNRPIGPGHPLALLPEEVAECSCDGMPAMSLDFC